MSVTGEARAEAARRWLDGQSEAAALYYATKREGFIAGAEWQAQRPWTYEQTTAALENYVLAKAISPSDIDAIWFALEAASGRSSLAGGLSARDETPAVQAERSSAPHPPSLDELEAKARAASAWGGWAIWPDLTEGGFVHVGNEGGVIPEGETATADDAEPNPIAKAYTLEIAEFIAAADPATVLSLIARVRTIEAVRAEEREKAAQIVMDAAPMGADHRTGGAAVAAHFAEVVAARIPGAGEGAGRMTEQRTITEADLNRIENCIRREFGEIGFGPAAEVLIKGMRAEMHARGISVEVPIPEPDVETIVEDLRAYAGNGTGDIYAPAELARRAADALEHADALTEVPDEKVAELLARYIAPAKASHEIIRWIHDAGFVFCERKGGE